jgi:hypothetical protein
MMLFHKKLIKNNLGEVWPNNWFRHFLGRNCEKSKKIQRQIGGTDENFFRIPQGLSM